MVCRAGLQPTSAKKESRSTRLLFRCLGSISKKSVASNEVRIQIFRPKASAAACTETRRRVDHAARPTSCQIPWHDEVHHAWQHLLVADCSLQCLRNVSDDGAPHLRADRWLVTPQPHMATTYC